VSEDRLFEELVQGQHARELLDNPVFQEIWTNLEQQIVKELKRSSPRDADGREKAILMLQLLEKLKSMIQQSIDTGKMASLEITRKQTLLDQAKQWIGRDGLIRSN